MVDVDALENEERALWGAALRVLRKRSRKTQEDLCDAAGISVASWKNYEKGLRRPSPDVLDRMLDAMGSDGRRFDQEVERLRAVANDQAPAPFGLSDRSRPFSIPVGGVAQGGVPAPTFGDASGEEVIDFTRHFGPTTRLLRVAGMSMIPFAEPGELVVYDLRKPPRRGTGCVVELKDGSFLVKRFERLDGGDLVVVELYPEERELTFPLADVQGIYQIVMRSVD